MERSGLAFAAKRGELCVIIFPPGSGERAFALLHEPEAHNVFEQAICAVNAAFVGHVQLQRARDSAACFTSTPMSDHVPELM